MSTTRIVAALAVAVAAFGVYQAAGDIPFSATPVVNIDMEAGVAGDTNHSGDDGPLSHAGGMWWNSVETHVSTQNLPTEFGLPTPFGVVFLSDEPMGDVFTDSGINNLQDSGTFESFLITGLIPGESYDLAVYLGYNGFVAVEHLGGTTSAGFTDPGADGWGLPGTEGSEGDYFYFPGLQPMQLDRNGVHGFSFSLDGVATGLQIRGEVPEPGALLLLALGVLPLARRR